MVLLRVAAGVLILAHGLVHLLYLADDVPEFSLDRSWPVPDAVRRAVARGLVAGTVVAFAALAVALWGLPGLSSAWPTLTVVACLFSTVLLVLFWNPWLVLGLAIDLALLAVVVLRPDAAMRVLS